MVELPNSIQWPVSYTHLDVYKRQGKYQAANNASDASHADMVEDESSVDGDVIDADK